MSKLFENFNAFAPGQTSLMESFNGFVNLNESIKIFEDLFTEAVDNKDGDDFFDSKKYSRVDVDTNKLFRLLDDKDKTTICASCSSKQILLPAKFTKINGLKYSRILEIDSDEFYDEEYDEVNEEAYCSEILDALEYSVDDNDIEMYITVNGKKYMVLVSQLDESIWNKIAKCLK